MLNDPVPTFDEVVDSDVHMNNDEHQFNWPSQPPIPELDPELDEPSNNQTITDDSSFPRRRYTYKQPEHRPERERTPPRPAQRLNRKTSPSTVRWKEDLVDASERSKDDQPPDSDDMTDILDFPTFAETPEFPSSTDRQEDMVEVTTEVERDRERSGSPRSGMTCFSHLGLSAVLQGQAYVEIDITPKNKHQLRNFAYHAQAFVSTQLRRQRIEVTLNRLSQDEHDKFKTAKDKEVQQWLKYEVVKAVSKQHNIPEEQVMRMRWVCTWKPEKNEQGEFTGKNKAKARLVILGFQDPELGSPTQDTASPTPSRTSRQVFLTVCAQLRFKVESGDVSTAFLQGRNLDAEKYTRGVPELCEALNVPHNSVLKILKGAYGLTTAPREWFESVKVELFKLGFVQSISEPCCWNYSVGNQIRGIVLFHVDDFLLAGSPECGFWQAMRKNLLQTWTWSPWETGNFTICGIEIQQLGDFSFVVHQRKYTQQIDPIPLSTARKKQKSEPVTETERSQLRGVNGALQWLATQSNPKVSAELSLSQSRVNTATVQDLIDANKLLQRTKADNNVDI